MLPLPVNVTSPVLPELPGGQHEESESPALSLKSFVEGLPVAVLKKEEDMLDMSYESVTSY